MAKALQVVCGLYPSGQVREPYSAVHFLHERIAVDQLYDLHFPYDEEPHVPRDADHAWSAWELCDAYAVLRGYRPRGGRPDAYRAGKDILREAGEGVVPRWV